MALYTYFLAPVQFCIESDCETPQKALEEALLCGSPNEVGLLNYLHNNIEDYPTLDDSVECVDSSED